MDRAFRAEVARKFSEAIKRRNVSKTRAARDLRVSREMLYRYLRAEAEPRPDVLARACRLWSISLNFRGASFTYSSFASADSTPEDSRIPKQSTLFDAIGTLRETDIRTKVLRKRSRSVELSVTIRFAG
jgi:hypothetical protein